VGDRKGHRVISSDATATWQAVERFNAAFNRHDVDEVMGCMTEDCVFENTSPAPDGERYEGADAVRGVWERLFAASPKARFVTEDQFVADDRAVVRWRYDWGAGHVRGVDVFRVRDGKIAEKLSYVKG
jgi:ketosteroid isomerase-like protein